MEQGSTGPGIIAIHAAHLYPATMIGSCKVTPSLIRCLTALEDMKYKDPTVGSPDNPLIDIDVHPKIFALPIQCLGRHAGWPVPSPSQIGVVGAESDTMRTMRRMIAQGRG